MKSFEALLRSLFLEKAFPPSSEPWNRWALSSQSVLCGGHLWVGLPFLGHWLPSTAGTLMLYLCPYTRQQGVWSAGYEVLLLRGGGL